MHSLTSLVLFTLAALVLGKSTNNNVPTTEIEITLKEYYTFIQSCTAFQYGQSCSWEDEAARQEYYRQTQDYPRFSLLHKQRFKEYIKESLSKGRKYCPSISKLVCDKTTEKCVCGEASVQVALGDDYKSSSYVLEEGVDGPPFCHWGKGTTCYPRTTPKSTSESETKYKFAKAGIVLDSACAKGFDCIVVDDNNKGKACTNTSMVDYVLQHMTGIVEPLSYGEVRKNILSGKVCACLESDKDAGSDKDNEMADDKDGRKKRDVSGDGLKSSHLYEEALNSWSPEWNY